MDLRQLEIFLSVAENASFTLASQQLYVAQSDNSVVHPRSRPRLTLPTGRSYRMDAIVIRYRVDRSYG